MGLCSAMLKNFFRLDNPVDIFDETALVAHFQHSRDIRNVLYQPAEWPVAIRSLKNVNFTNVSLSKTQFSNVTFTECHFRDCLFIGAEFDHVEFHRCTFINCNPHKARFNDCYLDPRTISFDKSYRDFAANVVLHIYHELYENAVNSRQYHWSAAADFAFRQWRRAQTAYDYKQGRLTKWQALSSNIASYIYEYSAGFGHRPLRFILSTLACFGCISIVNSLALPGSIAINGRTVEELTVIDSIFYSVSMLTALGFSSITPVSAGAKLLAVAEAFLGIGWLGIYTALLVKRFIR